MPLKTPKSKTKKAVQKAISANISELTHHGSRPRTRKQIIAISIAAAKKKK